MKEIILGEEQVQVLNSTYDFIQSKEIALTINGFAGSGKSLITRYIIEHLEKKRIHYTLCAPTHAAKVVLERFTNRSGITLHKLLSLSPNIEIMNLDFRDLKFIFGNSGEHFPTKGIILCDEASMIPDDLFDLLLQRCKEYECKVIFICDGAQLRPVKADANSKVLDLPNKLTLNKIYRQSSESGLITVLPKLRTEIIYNFEEAIGTEGSLYIVNDAKELFEKAYPAFKKAIKNSDILETKMLAYTNARVSAFNIKMKELLFGDKKEYNKFEFLTGCENLEFNKTKFWNSLDYIIIDEPVKREVLIPDFMKLPGYDLNLYNSSTDEVEQVFILQKDIPKDYLDSLAYHIENTRLAAIDSKRYNKRVSNIRWANYYKLIKSFTSPIDLYYSNRLIRSKSFDYGYAISTHRSQGRSLNNVFIDMKNIRTCRNQDELRQLQYVAVSRARTNAYILQ